MARTISTTSYDTGVTDLYAYYSAQSLADYVADKVLFVEMSAPDSGKYVATIDETKGTSIVAFRGASQPASWGEAIPGLHWDLTGATSLEPDSVAAIVAGVYDSLAGIQPTVSLTFDPRTMTIRLVDGDDWLEDVRTIDIPITLPDVVTDLNKCTATFGAVKGSTRIDRIAEVLDIEGEPYVRLTFLRADTLGKQSGRYSWDARVQYTESLITSTITVYSGVLELVKGIAKLPGEIT